MPMLFDMCVGILPKGSSDSFLHPALPHPNVYLLILAKIFIFSQNSLSLLLADMESHTLTFELGLVLNCIFL